MVPILTINSVNFAEWATSGGIQISPLYRKQKSVVAQDGTEYRVSKMKWQFQITTVDVNEDTLLTLGAAILGANPATVTENLTSPGYLQTRTCYISSPSYAPKKVKGGKTDFTSMSVTLEEK